MAKNNICDICQTSLGVIRFVKKQNLYLCEKHRRQFKLYSKVIDERPSKSKIIENEIIKHPDYAEIILYDKFNYEISRTLIDIEDIEKCRTIVWHSKGEYVCGTINNKKIYLHRFIMNLYDNTLVIDHVNHGKLDNRKNNLRICTNSQNHMNQRKHNRNTSGTKGVHWDKTNNQWTSSIACNKKYIFLGRYTNIKDAVKARKEAEEKYFGEFNYNELEDFIYAS